MSSVRTSQPVTACLASQYAGWALRHEAASRNSSRSAPGRRGRSPAGSRSSPSLRTGRSPTAPCWCVEADAAPPPAVAGEGGRRIAASRPDRLTVLFAPIRSLAGSVQIVARVVEVALHKAHALKFPLDRILDAAGSAPLSPPHPDFATSMGRTNDAIIFGGRVQLFVSGPRGRCGASWRSKLPSSASRDYGAPFAEVFRRFGGDFYAIDPMLFSPAAVAVTALESGETFRAGAIAADLLDASFP